MERVQWLDGWRAVAVATVIASHLALTYGWDSIGIPGKLGVYIFFAISGYIVTKVLLIERGRVGKIDLPHFYVRRALRILPPLAIYLVFCVALYWPSIAVQIGAAQSLLFTCNIGIGNCGWVFTHTWSLGFEEQFYLLLPFVLIKTRSWRSGILLGLALVLALLPFAEPLYFVGRVGFIQIYMLLGLGALYARYEAKIAPILAEIPAVISLAALAFAGVWTLLDPSLFQVVSALLVAPCVFIGVFALPQRSAPTRWLLGSWPLRTIGLYSYTLYLWQQLALTKAAWNVGVVPVLGLVGAFAFSVLSYHTVEAACRRIARAIKPRTVAVSTPLP